MGPRRSSEIQSKVLLVGAGVQCEFRYHSITLRLLQRRPGHQLALTDRSRPAAWAISMPSWTKAERISWMFCLAPISGVLDGVGIPGLRLVAEFSGLDPLLEAGGEDAGAYTEAELEPELEKVVDGGACCCVVVLDWGCSVVVDSGWGW